MKEEKMDFTAADHYNHILQTINKQKKTQKKFYPLTDNPVRYHWEFLKMLFFLKKIIPKNKHLVFVCIGVSEYMGDAFGPVIGWYMDQKNRGITFYGQVGNSINGDNLNEYIEKIYRQHPDDFIIVIDSAINPNRQKIGTIQVLRRGICPGTPSCGSTARIGDVTILGFTETSMERLKKLTDKDEYVIKMAYFTRDVILKYVDWFAPQNVIFLEEEMNLLRKKPNAENLF